MARSLDLIVFGATGVTGKFVVEELALHGGDVKWGIAGRSKDKMNDVLKEMGELTGKDLSAIEIVAADIKNSNSLKSMCEKAKIVLNCVGPYRFFGEQVVNACVESATHYVDVSGEPQFLESMQLKYFEKAKEKNIYIVGACGFDSIPCDMGVEFLKQKFEGDVNGVETYLQICTPETAKANFGTWQSAIHSFANSSELRALRKSLKEKVFTKKTPKFEYPLKPRSILFKSEDVDQWCIPFIGSDKSVVLRSQLYKYQYGNEKPLQTQTYFCSSSLFYAVATLFIGGVFAVLAKFAFGRYLLEEYPGFFSLGVFTKSPRRDQLTGGSFSMTLCAKGWSEKLAEPTDIHSKLPDKKIKVIVSGPDPGYVTTSICIVSSSLTILKEKDKMPQGGGVFTPAAAFGKTSLIEKLNKRGLVMNVVV